MVQDRTIRVSWKVEVLAGLQRLFSGAAGKRILDELVAIHGRVLKSRVFVALHMHAGDGNVHTNIPVNSDDYGMLREAHAAVERIMQIARDLDGVISGEHGIGLTKYEFLTEAELAPFQEYKRRVDPNGHFNAGKLMPGADLRHAWTPSFSLMGHESLIMQQSDIGAISESIKDCLRCGKCKPVCSTHVPRANLLYSPRNKILATSLLVEAFLYEEQTRRGVSLKHWEEFEDVADHCTVCHKCYTPCPVDIDFGDVSMNMRALLRRMGRKSFNPGTASAMFFLNAKDPATINATRKAMVGVGYKIQRAAHDLLSGLARKRPRSRPPRWASRRCVSRSSTSSTRRCRAACPSRPRASCWTSRTPTTFRSSAIRRRPRPTPRRCSTSRLRFRAPVLAGGPGDPGDAVARRRADRAAAWLPVLRLSPARQRHDRQGRADHHRQPGAVPPRGQHAELPGHQDRGGQLRHLLRPAVGL